MVETSADYAIERAKKQKDDQDNLTWGEFVKTSAAGKAIAVIIRKESGEKGGQEAG